VLWDITRDKKKRTSVYHQLIALIAIFDVNTSLVWMVGTLPVTKYSELTGLEWGIYGAQGNEASCDAQAFFFQLGKFIDRKLYAALSPSSRQCVH
jgi:hypothetical protein